MAGRVDRGQMLTPASASTSCSVCTLPSIVHEGDVTALRVAGFAAGDKSSVLDDRCADS